VSLAGTHSLVGTYSIRCKTMNVLSEQLVCFGNSTLNSIIVFSLTQTCCAVTYNHMFFLFIYSLFDLTQKFGKCFVTMNCRYLVGQRLVNYERHQ